MRCRHSLAPTLGGTRQAKAARKGAMCAGGFRLFVWCRFRLENRDRNRKSSVREASVFCAVPGQNKSLRYPHSRAGGELDIGSHAGARPEPKYAFVSYAVSDVMQRTAYTRGVCIERVLSRTQGELTAPASEQTIGWHFDHVERGLLWRFVRIRFARAKGCSLLKPWSR